MMAVAAVGAAGFAAQAAIGARSYEVIQKRRSFGIEAIVIKPGDALSFVNKDPYAHNVYSREPKGWLDLGIQEEDDRQAVVFDRPGVFDIRCRIHPKMRLMVTVKD